jgi:hypothetical protein
MLFYFVGPDALKVFAYSVETNEDFPLHDGGNVVFQRDWFIQETSRFVLEKKKPSTKYGSYYWSAPVGSGKTVFFEAIGKRSAEPWMPSLSYNCK